ncbi:NUDIX hydrolase [Candidatus Gracilibacteria bacterium]|nr:NUDIX hydrolase [Candidatus Gracilibacteria bacterium]
MNNLFKIYARAIIINGNNDILLIKKRENQKIGGGEWLLPGGTLEFGENVEYTLIREVKEETNLDIKEIVLLSNKKMIIGNTHWLGMYFLCKVKDEKKMSNMEVEKHETVGFFSLKDIPKMKDYMMIKMLYDFFDDNVSDFKQYSMQEYLFKCLDNKFNSFMRKYLDEENSI